MRLHHLFLCLGAVAVLVWVVCDVVVCGSCCWAVRGSVRVAGGGSRPPGWARSQGEVATVVQRRPSLGRPARRGGRREEGSEARSMTLYPIAYRYNDSCDSTGLVGVVVLTLRCQMFYYQPRKEGGRGRFDCD